jgi:7-carboxy-7-deazaguanine synthase
MQAEDRSRKGVEFTSADNCHSPDRAGTVTALSEPVQSNFRISEIYESIQGEGLLTGTPSIFVRTSGCNLRCWFCDTRFASWEPEGDYQSVDQILEACRSWTAKHIVLTGGEPMIFKALPELTRAFRREGWHLTIETAGTIDLPVECDLMSLSPKLAGSTPRAKGHTKDGDASSGASPNWIAAHNRRRERLEIVASLMKRCDYQLKFVVHDQSDADELLLYLNRLAKVSDSLDRDRVMVMPQGTDSETLDRQAEWLLPWCQKHKVRFCPRAHIHWFGDRRGT